MGKAPEGARCRLAACCQNLTARCLFRAVRRMFRAMRRVTVIATVRSALRRERHAPDRRRNAGLAPGAGRWPGNLPRQPGGVRAK